MGECPAVELWSLNFRGQYDHFCLSKGAVALRSAFPIRDFL